MDTGLNYVMEDVTCHWMKCYPLITQDTPTAGHTKSRKTIKTPNRVSTYMPVYCILVVGTKADAE